MENNNQKTSTLPEQENSMKKFKSENENFDNLLFLLEKMPSANEIYKKLENLFFGNPDSDIFNNFIEFCINYFTNFEEKIIPIISVFFIKNLSKCDKKFIEQKCNDFIEKFICEKFLEISDTHFIAFFSMLNEILEQNFEIKLENIIRIYKEIQKITKISDEIYLNFLEFCLKPNILSKFTQENKNEIKILLKNLLKSMNIKIVKNTVILYMECIKNNEKIEDLLIFTNLLKEKSIENMNIKIKGDFIANLILIIGELIEKLINKLDQKAANSIFIQVFFL